ncbi:RICIN domain-containing protein [Streptomyces sp. LN699]|uniref:RICIN domain-containing protein n=1 Tax=Streptomyces sp. LN699 TaxID=3112981 RepID=UPI00371449CD
MKRSFPETKRVEVKTRCRVLRSTRPHVAAWDAFRATWALWKSYARGVGVVGDKPAVIAVHAANGKCLDIENGGTGNGAPVQIHTCNGIVAQQWTMFGDDQAKAAKIRAEVAFQETGNAARRPRRPPGTRTSPPTPPHAWWSWPVSRPGFIACAHKVANPVGLGTAPGSWTGCAWAGRHCRAVGPLPRPPRSMAPTRSVLAGDRKGESPGRPAADHPT